MKNTVSIVLPVASTPEATMKARLKLARSLANKSASMLGQEIGNHLNINPISDDTVYRWERTGNVPGMYLNAIAKSLGVEFDFFAL